MSLPKPRRTTFSSTRPEAIDAIAAGKAPCLTSGRCAILSKTSPTAPATPETEKLGKRNTANIAVKPMAGTASSAPDTSPFNNAWRTSSMRSNDLHQNRLAGLDLFIQELAVEDIALVVEVTRPGGTRIVDLLAGRDRLQPVDSIVDRLAAALRHLADIVLDDGAGRALPDRHGHQHHVHMVVDLAGIGIGTREAGELLHPRQRAAAFGHGRCVGVHAFDHFVLADLFDQLLVDGIGLPDDLALVAGTIKILQQ